MGRKRATGRFETHEELVAAVFANSRIMNDSQNARAVGVTATTVAKIIREGTPPSETVAIEGIEAPHRADNNEVLNHSGDAIAHAKTETIAIVIANALNEVDPNKNEG